MQWSHIVAKAAAFSRNHPLPRHPLGWCAARALERLVRFGPAREIVVETAHGLVLCNSGSAFERVLLFRGTHEPQITAVLRQVVRPGAVCLDIGAHSGYHTLTMARAAGPEGRVIAVEPQAAMLERLRRNVALNRLRNVTAVRAAVWNEEGEGLLTTPPGQTGRPEAGALQYPGASADGEPVRTVTGEALLRETGVDACDVLKIDVEGADLIVLRQFEGMVSRCRPTLILEYSREFWGRFGSELQEALGLLADLDYDVYVDTWRALEPYRKPPAGIANLVGVPRP